jgi:outer membrane lipoprotein-sorting protein
MRVRTAGLPALLLITLTLPPGPDHPGEGERRAAADLLAQSRAAYAALESYADSGTVVEDVGSFRNHSRFKTRFRKPADFYFEYTSVESISFDNNRTPLANHLVLWKLGPDLQAWNEQFRTHDTYPQGEVDQVTPLRVAMAGTSGTSTLIPSLLFPDAGFVGTIQEIGEFSLAGNENLGGHECRKLIGIARSVYPSGQITNVRPVTVWLDTRTLLVRKVFTDTPKGYPMGGVARLTITLDPQANPPLDDSKFQFIVPVAQE